MALNVVSKWIYMCPNCLQEYDSRKSCNEHIHACEKIDESAVSKHFYPLKIAVEESYVCRKCVKEFTDENDCIYHNLHCTTRMIDAETKDSDTMVTLLDFVDDVFADNIIDPTMWEPATSSTTHQEFAISKRSQSANATKALSEYKLEFRGEHLFVDRHKFIRRQNSCNNESLLFSDTRHWQCENGDCQAQCKTSGPFLIDFKGYHEHHCFDVVTSSNIDIEQSLWHSKNYKRDNKSTNLPISRLANMDSSDSDPDYDLSNIELRHHKVEKVTNSRGQTITTIDGHGFYKDHNFENSEEHQLNPELMRYYCWRKTAKRCKVKAVIENGILIQMKYLPHNHSPSYPSTSHELQRQCKAENLTRRAVERRITNPDQLAKFTILPLRSQLHTERILVDGYSMVITDTRSDHSAVRSWKCTRNSQSDITNEKGKHKVRIRCPVKCQTQNGKLISLSNYPHNHLAEKNLAQKIYTFDAVEAVVKEHPEAKPFEVINMARELVKHIPIEEQPSYKNLLNIARRKRLQYHPWTEQPKTPKITGNQLDKFSYHYDISKKGGKRVLVVDGYRFQAEALLANGKQNWSCIVRNCKPRCNVRAQTLNDKLVTLKFWPHRHGPGDRNVTLPPAVIDRPPPIEETIDSVEDDNIDFNVFGQVVASFE